MRQNSGNRRSGRGRGRRQHGNQRNHTFDSAGPDVRVRGTAAQVYEKYQTLAREASTGGDKVMAESYWQFAEHYFRIMNANAPSRDDDDDEEGQDNQDGERRQGGNRQRNASGNGAERSDDEPSEGDESSDADETAEGDQPQRRDRRRRRQQAEGEGDGGSGNGGTRRRRSEKAEEAPAEGLMQTLARGSDTESEAAE